MSADDTRAGEVAAEEVEAGVRAMVKATNIFKPMSYAVAVRAALVAAYEIHDARVRAERDAALDLHAKAVEIGMRVVTERDDARAERDRLATEAETQHRLRGEAEQHARDADRERDRVAAGVRELAYSENAQAVLFGVTGTHPTNYGGVTKDEALECAGELLTDLRALLAPADDGEVG